MTPDQAIDLAADIQEKWSNQPIEIRTLAEALYKDLVNVPVAEAQAAIAAIAASGQRSAEFVPTPGQILRKVAELDIAPLGWDEVRRQLIKRMGEVERLSKSFRWTCPDGRCGGDGMIVDEATRTGSPCSCRPRYIAARRGIGELDPMVRQWIDDGFVTWTEVGTVAEGDLTAEAQMRTKWEAHAARAVESRVLVLLPSAAPSRRLEQAKVEDERLTVGKRQHGAMRTLGAGPTGADSVLEAAGLRFDREAVRR